MGTNAFVGTILVKSTINDDPVSTDFFTDNVQMTVQTFTASELLDQKRALQINYGLPLKDGTHVLEIGSDKPAQLEYKARDRYLPTRGTVEVTVSNNQGKQVGNINVTYLDEIGRTVQLTGKYEVEYFIKKP